MNVRLKIPALLALLSAPSFSQDMIVNVTNILTTTNGSFSGCMVKFAPVDAIADQAGIPSGTGDGQCARGFVTLDCDGQWLSKSVSTNLLSAAQLAQVTGKRLYVVVDSTRKANGYCSVTRIDNLPN